MERLSTLDAGFYFAEADGAPLHIASVTVLEGPAPTYDEMVAMTLARLPLLPRYRRKVRAVTLGRPVWVDDPHFQIDHHVRHAMVPSPGGTEELRALAAQVLAERIDLTRPPWELWLVEGLEGGRWALIAKVHHCVVDGVGGAELMTTLFDVCRESAFAGVPEPWTPHSEPGPLSLMVRGLAATAREFVHPPVPGLTALRDAWAFVGGLPHAFERLAHAGIPATTRVSDPSRLWHWTSLDLDQVKEVRAAFGTTVNDVVLAVVTHGFRELLAARDDLEPGDRLRSLVPVSVRHVDETGSLTNRVSAVIADLPWAEPDPVRRLTTLHEQMDELKRSRQAMAAVRLAGYAPALLAAVARTTMAVARPLFQTVITNVPGPPFPLYVLGRQVIGIYPYVPVAAGAHVSVGIFSYHGVLHFGITGDPEAVPDLETLVKGIDHGFSELHAAAAGM